MKKIILLFIVVSFCTIASAQQKLSLTKTISIALQKNTDLIKNTNALEVNKAAVKNAYGEFLPTLGVNGTASWRREDIYTPTTKIDYLGQVTVLNEVKNESRSYNLSAGGSWTLFDGLSNFANLSKSEKQLEMAKLNLAKKKQDIVYTATNLYYNVLKARKVMQVNEENVKYTKKFLEQIEEMQKLGSIPIADLYSQQVQSGNAELQYIQAQNNFEREKSALLNFLSLDIMLDYEYEEVNLDNILSENVSEFENLELLLQRALNQRLDYQAQKLDFETTLEDVTIAKSGLLPSLSSNYSISTSSSNNLKNLFDNRGLSASLNLNIPIFSNWSTEYRIQAEKVKSLNAQEDVSLLERQIKIDVKQGYLNLTAAKKKLEVSSKNLQAAEENRKINIEKYRLGSGTIIEKLEADKNYISAQSSQIESQFEFLILRDQLKNNLGELKYQNFE